jgi:DNA topoisomerase-3
MSKTLIIAEKPDAGREIARALGVQGQGQGCIEGQDTIVSWCVGHILEELAPDEVDEGLKEWRLDTLPFRFQAIPKRPAPGKEAQLKTLEQLIQRSDVTEIVNAGDAGREGELIVREVLDRVGSNGKRMSRMWFSDLTEQAISRAFRERRPLSDYDHLAAAALARSSADYHLGLNLTRFLAIKSNGKVRAGRVYTPLLWILADRERTIQQFRPTDYFVIGGQASKDDQAFKVSQAQSKNEEGEDLRETDRAKVEAVLATAGDTGSVTKAAREEKRIGPPLPYSLADLQGDMDSWHGLGAKETLQIAQSLYEQHKLISYPRTDSGYLSQSVFAEIDDHLAALVELMPEAVARARENIKQGPGAFRCVNDGKLTDHHGIIVTKRKPDLSSLSEKERLVYQAVAERTVAAFSDPAVYDTLAVEITSGDVILRASGSVQREAGWHGVISRAGKNDSPLPDLHEGDEVGLEIGVAAKKTSPPKRITEGQLIKSIMTRHGLGTAATRQDAVEKLYADELIAKSKGGLVVTEKGLALDALGLQIIPEVCNPAYSGKMEALLGQVEAGEYGAEEFLGRVHAFVAQVIQKYRSTECARIGNSSRPEVGKCPKCGAAVREYKKVFACEASLGDEAKCEFRFFKQIAGKEISASAAKQLLEKGQTSRAQKFKSKAGKTFEAKLKLDAAAGKVEFLFEDKKPRK